MSYNILVSAYEVTTFMFIMSQILPL